RAVDAPLGATTPRIGRARVPAQRPLRRREQPRLRPRLELRTHRPCDEAPHPPVRRLHLPAAALQRGPRADGKSEARVLAPQLGVHPASAPPVPPSPAGRTATSKTPRRGSGTYLRATSETSRARCSLTARSPPFHPRPQGRGCRARRAPAARRAPPPPAQRAPRAPRPGAGCEGGPPGSPC